MEKTKFYDTRFSPAWNYRHAMWYGEADHRVSIVPWLVSIVATPVAALVGGPVVAILACVAPHTVKRISDDLFDGVVTLPKLKFDTSLYPEWEKKEEKKPYTLDHTDRVNKLKEWGITYN